jgi:hypothetical protein
VRFRLRASLKTCSSREKNVDIRVNPPGFFSKQGLESKGTLAMAVLIETFRYSGTEPPSDRGSVHKGRPGFDMA